jgi:hypothetical protein
MLRGIWNRLFRRRRAATVGPEVERERMSPAERDFADESIDDIQADEFVTEHLGGIRPERLSDDDEPPRG